MLVLSYSWVKLRCELNTVMQIGNFFFPFIYNESSYMDNYCLCFFSLQNHGAGEKA